MPLIGISAKSSHALANGVRCGTDARKSATFTIQFFSNPQGEDEGKTFLGQKSVTTGSGGKASFTFKSDQAVPVGQNVTATATNGGGSTSEFSDPKLVTFPPQPL
jgi:hypothetical protein